MTINVTVTERQPIAVTFTETQSSGRSTWGNITGDISNQEDLISLMTALAIVL